MVTNGIYRDTFVEYAIARGTLKGLTLYATATSMDWTKAKVRVLVVYQESLALYIERTY